MDRLLFVLLLALAKGEEEATVEEVRDDVETVGGVWGRIRDPESPLVHLQVKITREMYLRSLQDNFYFSSSNSLNQDYYCLIHFIKRNLCKCTLIVCSNHPQSVQANIS